jgi:hypothetical protein
MNSNLPKWLQNAEDLLPTTLDNALDIVYQNISCLAQANDFGTMNSIFAQTQTLELPLDLILALLVSTKRHARKLPSRASYLHLSHYFFTAEN